MGRKATITYNLKSTTGQLNIHEEKYSPELRQYVQDSLAEMIHYFDYAKYDVNGHQAENLTGFYDFSGGDATTINNNNDEHYRETQGEFRADS